LDAIRAVPSAARKMTPKGIEIVRDALKKVYETDREVLMPIQEFYRLNIEERLSNDRYWK